MMIVFAIESFLTGDLNISENLLGSTQIKRIQYLLG